MSDDDLMALVEELYEPFISLLWLSAGEKLDDDDILKIDEMAEPIERLWQCLRERQVAADLSQLDIRNLRHPGAKTARCASTLEKELKP